MCCVFHCLLIFRFCGGFPGPRALENVEKQDMRHVAFVRRISPLVMFKAIGLQSLTLEDLGLS
jgi:hypothetical protein